MIIENLMNSSIRRLSHVFRYSSIPTIRKESVAEHTAYVALYSLIIAKDVIKRGYSVNLGLLLERALVHDLDESMTGDFLRTVKYAHPDLKKALDEVSVRFLTQLEDSIGVSILPAWRSAKNDDIEGAILKLVDLLQVFTYVLEEQSLGNTPIRAIIPECLAYMKKLRDADFHEFIVPYVDEVIRLVDSGYEL